MKHTFNTIALIGKYHSQEVRDSLKQLADHLRMRGHDVVIDQETARTLGLAAHEAASLPEIGRKADVAVVMGGDGTLLHIARSLHIHGMPLIGVNQGRVGFLTDVPIAGMTTVIDAMLEGHYQIERRILLDTAIERGGKRIARAHAFNDVVVNMGTSGRLIEYEVAVDGQYVYKQRADGLVVSTPTGSTAYSLSAGGPILHPSLAAVVLTPICPQNLSNRPIVINSASQIEVRITRAISAHAHFDGQTLVELEQNDVLKIKRSRKLVELLHPEGHSYFDALRQKLHWNSDF